MDFNRALIYPGFTLFSFCETASPFATNNPPDDSLLMKLVAHMEDTESSTDVVVATITTLGKIRTMVFIGEDEMTDYPLSLFHTSNKKIQNNTLRAAPHCRH